MPEETRKKFSNSNDVFFNIKEAYVTLIHSGKSSKEVLKESIEQHAKICIENSEDIYDALALSGLLEDDIDYRINQYIRCICKSTTSFINWLNEDYRKKLRVYLYDNFDTVYEEIHGVPPKDD